MGVKLKLCLTNTWALYHSSDELFQAYLWHLEDSPCGWVAQWDRTAYGHVSNVEILARCQTFSVES